jgi:carboxypeptidase T
LKKEKLMPRYHVKVIGESYDAMADLVRKYKIPVSTHTVKKVGTGYRVDAHATDAQVKRLEAAGYEVERYEDADKVGKARQRELRQATGRAGRTAAALHVATAGKYLDVVEVERALASAAAPPNDSFTRLIPLPHKTWEKRICNALKIGKGTGANRPAIYFLGGVHAREWGSPDILINFVQQLTQAYRANAGITVGNKTFTAAQIKGLVNSKDVFVFPQANPDGRNFSMTKQSMWRKNRRPAPAGHTQPRCVGVDLNRNFDFLWDFTKYFDPNSPIANSKDPCDPDIYIGPSAVSEPETKNAVWLLDQNPNIRYFIDIHSFSEDILYNWGDDLDQSSDPNMSFRNAAFDGKRGIANDTTYKEYLDSADKTMAIKLAKVMSDAIKTVRGRVYTVMQSMSLYPTAGSSDDYAYSRHLVDSTKPKILSYTIEWGSADNPTPFHPAYSEMQIIIKEITTALLAFCIAAT